ncbi:MAG: S-methyl-5-thioribose-1-phosphate isomerase [Elusimicrobiota bacterium]
MIPPRLIYRKGELKILDQRAIPCKTAWVKATDAVSTASAIRDMVLRGAPLIGCASAYGYVLAFENKKFSSAVDVLSYFKKIKKILNSSRPTAVALFASSDRMEKIVLESLKKYGKDIKKEHISNEIYRAVFAEARRIEKEDIDSTLAMAENGMRLLKKGSRVITYCNTGALATMGIGTALGVITQGHKKGKVSFAYSCETRPYLQGTRLTIWELQKNNVPSALITDNMAAHIMSTEKIDAILIGADRIAANGDTANKIGSYQLAIAAKYHKIPFFVVAPMSTFDLKLKTGKEIKIEERSEREVTELRGLRLAPKGIRVRHPAFDVTPNSLITAIITEKGIISPVNSRNVLRISP